MDMAAKAGQKRKPTRKAMAQPVQAPVTGRGTATNKAKAVRLKLSCSRMYFLLVREKSQVKNLSQNVNLRSQSETGPRKRSKGTTGKRFPSTANRYACQGS